MTDPSSALESPAARTGTGDSGWAGLLTTVHDMLFACDRETRFTLAGTDRRLWLTVRADSVTVEIPAYAPVRLTTLGWRAPAGDRDLWFYDVPRTVEHVDWLCRFAVHGASLLIDPDPATLTFREDGPADTVREEARPAPTLTVVPDPDPEPSSPVGPDTSPVPSEPALTVVPEPAPTVVPEPALTVVPEPEPAPAPTAVPEPALTVVPEPVLTVVPEPQVAARTAAEELTALRAVLTEAVAERDLTGYLSALRTAAVCMPLLEDPSPETGVRPAVVRGADNAIFLPIFTSADGLTEFAGNGVPFIAISFNDLIDDWPEPDWGVIIDPRTDRALTLTAVSLAELRAADPPDAQFAAAAAG